MPRGHIRQRKSGSWSAVVELGRDPLTNRRRQRWLTAPTRKAAQALLTKALAELDAGTYQEPSNLTVAEYLDRWLTDYAAPQLRPTSLDTYRGMIGTHVLPALGALRVTALRPLHLQELYRTVQAPGYHGGRCLSGTSALLLHSILHRAFVHAVRWQVLPRNPADQLEPPRKSTAERPVLELDGLVRLLHAVDETWLHLPVLLAVTTGMRRGEVLGLRWQDVSAASGEVRIRQTVVRAAGSVQFGPPKTKSGRRAISVPELLLHAFARRRLQQESLARDFGALYHDHGLVICWEDGRPYNPARLTDSYRAVRHRLGLPVTFHDLRHSHSTLLLLLGVHARIVQERLGHSNVSMTLDTYSHILPSMQSETAALIDRTFRAVLEPVRPAALAAGLLSPSSAGDPGTGQRRFGLT